MPRGQQHNTHICDNTCDTAAMNDSVRLLEDELGALLALLGALPEFLVAVLEVELALDVGEQEVGQQEDLIQGFGWTL